MQGRGKKKKLNQTKGKDKNTLNHVMGRTKKTKKGHNLMDRCTFVIQFVFPGQSVKPPVKSIITVDPSVDRRRSKMREKKFLPLFPASRENVIFLSSIFILHKHNITQPLLCKVKKKKKNKKADQNCTQQKRQGKFKLNVNMDDR